MTIKHGTGTGYRYHKCRCDLCKRWNAQSQADRRQRRKTGRTPHHTRGDVRSPEDIADGARCHTPTRPDPLQVPPELRGRLIGNAVARRKRGAERLRIIQRAAASGYPIKDVAKAFDLSTDFIRDIAPDLVWTDATVRADDKRIVLRVTETGAKRDAMVSLPRGPHDLADEAQPDARAETAPRRNHMVGQRVPARRGLTADEVIEIIRAARDAVRAEHNTKEAAHG